MTERSFNVIDVSLVFISQLIPTIPYFLGLTFAFSLFGYFFLGKR